MGRKKSIWTRGFVEKGGENLGVPRGGKISAEGGENALTKKTKKIKNAGAVWSL